MQQQKIDSLEVVLKITERCNIDCSYCYMFNHENSDYLQHPPYMTMDTMHSVAAWVAQAIEDYGIRSVTLILHGGEPMMLKPGRFDAMCAMFRTTLGDLTHLRLGMQTNATLIDEDWIRLFAKHRVSIGVSLDGPEDINDVNRIDHKGKGTYARTLAGLKVLQRAHAVDLLPEPGVICVIDPAQDSRKIYRHFVDDLGIKYMSFLLPMNSHDQMTAHDADRVDAYLSAILDEWLADDNPYIEVRMFNQYLNFLSASDDAKAQRMLKGHDAVIVAVASNGEISVNDELKCINFGQNIGTVANTSLKAFLDSPVHAYLDEVWNTVPSECDACAWVGYCRGGAQNQAFTNRHSMTAGFNNRSIFCSALKHTYSRLASYMVGAGLPASRLVDLLYSARVSVKTSQLPLPVLKRNVIPLMAIK